MTMNEELQSELNSCSLYTQVLNSAAEAIICLDAGGRCTFVNRSCLSILGYSDDSVFLGSLLHELIYCAASGDKNGAQHAACRVMESILKGEEYYNPDEQLLRSDGSLINTLYRACPLISEKGALSGAVVTFVDTAPQKILEEQLRQAQKIEAIGTLAGGVAHDFNNILTAIIGFGTLMEMKMSADDPMMRSLQQILAAADRAADLTRSLLAFSRKQLADMRIISLNRVVQNLEKMLKRLLREDIELCVTLCQEDTDVMADSGQIEQVLFNLATNAGDAMPKGGAISISTSRCMLDEAFAKRCGLAAPGPYVLFSFADNGCGMDCATAARIFDPLFTTKEAGEGTGLGLSVCYGIIRKHNGYIECDSEKGAGTVFRIYLPEVTPDQTAHERGAALTHLKGDETVLLAEDDQAVRTLNKRMLEQFGYRVIEAADGAAALDLYRQNRSSIRLCILDAIMPKKSGVEVYHEIRSIDAEAAIIFISGYSEQFLQKQDLPAGVKLVKKPVTPVRFLETIKDELRRVSENSN